MATPPTYGSPSPPPSALRRALRLVAWNASLLLAGLALIGLAGEVWLRLTTPFFGRHYPRQFVPGVGVIGQPDSEVRWASRFDYLTVSRTNSLGFLDREPIAPERAAESCHVAVIGDSFVEAKKVAIADKFHVVLEALAARELPHLDVTTSAFGYHDTGQVAQLPFYDEYARRLGPRLLVLVVVPNDLEDNSALLKALSAGWDPERTPHVTAARDGDGKIGLRPPHPDYRAFRLARDTGLSESAAHALIKTWNRVEGTSLFADWLAYGIRRWHGVRLRAARVQSFEQLHRPGFMRPSWTALARVLKDPESVTADLRLFVQEVVDMTVFALDQFKARADRDGTALVILATARVDTRPGRADGLRAMAAARGIPVVSQHDHIIRRGGRIEDAHWQHDIHWSPTGHRWAAEALLEWLREHQDVCEPRGTIHEGAAAESPGSSSSASAGGRVSAATEIVLVRRTPPGT